MLALISLLGYILGVVLVLILGFFTPVQPILLWLTAGLAGGVLSFLLTNIYYYTSVPKAFRGVPAKAKRTGIILFLIGRDRKLKIVPGETDGLTIKPLDKKLKEKYEWIADSSAGYTLHNGSGIQAFFATVDYAFPVDPWIAAALDKLRELGYDNLEAIKMAKELPTPEAVQEKLGEVDKQIAEIEEMEDQQVIERYGLDKETLLHRLYRERDTLEKLLHLARQYGAGLAVNPAGRLVNFDVIERYLCFQHNPERVKRRVHAAVNAMVAKMTNWRMELMKWGVLIAIVALAIIGVLGALHFLAGGGGGPVETVASHVTSMTNATTTTVAPNTTTTSIPQVVETTTTTLANATGGGG